MYVFLRFENFEARVSAPYGDQYRTMKKPNYSHEKRQRELAKQKKKDEKKLNKAKNGGADEKESATI